MADRAFPRFFGDWWAQGGGWSPSGWPGYAWSFGRRGEPDPGAPDGDRPGAPDGDRRVGGPGDDTLRGDVEDALIDGRGGYDTARIVGTAGDDDLAVGRNIAADDPSLYVFGNGLYGAERVEIRDVERLEVLGLAGDDRLVVASDVFGTDEIAILGGVFTVEGVDIIVFRGGAGDDELDATLADGPIVGRGGSGADVLAGGEAADVLRGGTGDDTLIGGGGADTLEGGPGGDAFVYADLADLLLDGEARERIADFAPGQDVIDLGAIDAVPGEGNDGFRFLGNISPDFQILMSGDLYFDPEDQALKGFVGDYVSYGPNFAIDLPGVEALSEDDLILQGAPEVPDLSVPLEPLPPVATIEVTFVSEDTDLANTLGYYVRDEAGGFTGEAGILFPEVSDKALEPGASNAVFGLFPGDVGFFLVRDGADLGIDWEAGSVRVEDARLVYTELGGARTVLADDRVSFDFEPGVLRLGDGVPVPYEWEDGVPGEPSYDGDFDDAVFDVAYPVTSGELPLGPDPTDPGLGMG